MRGDDWIQTFSGRVFWPLDPRPEDVQITDIAHALSQICRYNGHCLGHYSVAQHSVLVSRIVPRADRLAGLLHDAPEAYLGDVARPLKGLPLYAEYRAAEGLLWRVIAGRFGISPELPQSVQHADAVLLATERRDLMVGCEREWRGLPAPLPVLLRPWAAERAKDEFLDRFEELWEQHEGARGHDAQG